MDKLARLGIPLRFLALLKAILQENIIAIEDGISSLEKISQTTGFAQGDNLSPILFSVLISDLPARITFRHQFVKVLMYADDLVLYSSSRFHLQQALVTLQKYCKEAGLIINETKTEAMKFRRGGRLATSDQLRLGTTTLRYTNAFAYLGFTLTPTGLSFSRHVRERVRKAKLEMFDIKTPQGLSLKTALQLFTLKVAPIAAYGIQLTWEHLSARDLYLLESVKSAFLKRVLGLHCTTRSRYTYILSGTSLFVADLMKSFKLSETESFKAFEESQEQKLADIDPGIFVSPAMTSEGWKQANRHIVTRFAVHGFHHLLCTNVNFHDPSHNCICKYCGLSCPKYHASSCDSAVSIRDLAK